jgi:hypothetical protein
VAPPPSLPAQRSAVGQLKEVDLLGDAVHGGDWGDDCDISD